MTKAGVKFKDPMDVLLYPSLTEKSVGMVERENKIVFVVRKNASKSDIKRAFEKLFNVKVAKVNTLVDAKGNKKAYIRLAKDYNAVDIATRLGML
jgi:large subunit ribosomal protein L23